VQPEEGYETKVGFLINAPRDIELESHFLLRALHRSAHITAAAGIFNLSF